MKDTLAKQCKSGPAEHHTFNEFNACYLAFYLSITVNKRQSGQNSRFVSLQTVGEALEFRDSTGFNLAYPGVELCCLTSAHEAKKLLDQVIDRLCCDAGLAQWQEVFLLVRLQFLNAPHQAPNAPLARK